MYNKTLNQNLFEEKKLESIPTRHGFGEGLVKAAEENEQIVGLCADLTESTRMSLFQKRFPERFVQLGVAEQNLAGIAAGMALTGKIPFAASYATFSPGRNWDQIRVSICYSKNNVKIVGAHAGLSVGPDGATHQALEDIAISRVLPNLTVIVPSDYFQARKATVAIAGTPDPTYLRLGRSNLPVFTTEDTDFEIGKANILKSGDDVTIIACGSMVYKSLLAAIELEKDNISAEVIDCHTIKPIDSKTILSSVSKTSCVVTVEEHQVTGGLGSAIAELLSQKLPTPMEVIGVEDKFGESGSPEELFEKYGLTVEKIISKVGKVLLRK